MLHLLGAACFGICAAPIAIPAGSASSGESLEPVQTGGDWDQSTVTCLLQSHAGYLWLATYHGLVRFDGSRFVVFDPGNTPELPNGLITSLYETPDGTLWIGHETGHLTKYQPGQFQRVPIDDDWPGGSVEAITTDEAGDLWLLNNAGALFRLRDSYQADIPGGASPTRKAALARATNGVNWLVADGKIAVLEHGAIRPFEPGPAESDEFFERVLPSRDGGLWVVTSQSLRKWSHGSWTPLPQTFVRPPGTITALLETRSGALLAGTLRSGLFLLGDTAAPQSFNTSGGVSHNWIRCLCEDHEGNLWFGTGAGLDRLRTRKIKLLKAPDEWKGCGVLSFAAEPNGSAWVGTEGAGLYRFERGLWTSCDESCGLSNSFVWSVLSTGNQLLVGTYGGGLYRRHGDNFVIPAELREILSPVTSLFQGSRGEIWIGTTTGVHRYESGRLTWSAGASELAFPDVRAIAESPDGTLWFGMSGGGIASCTNNVLRQYRRPSGLGSDYVLCLLPDGPDVLWIGTADQGLTRLKNGKFSVITGAQGLPSSVIYHLVDDQTGNLWMGSQGGILRASKADLNRCADGLAAAVPVLAYGLAEGLESRSCSGGFQPGAARSPDGRLWFPTPKGIAIVDPANVTTNPVAPPVLIEELLVDDRPMPLPQGSGRASPVEIPADKRRIQFRYTACSFAAPDKVQFRHKFEGIEHQWVGAGSARTVEYNLMSAGTYTFHVKACNNDGLWNEQGATISITLLPYFWQTWWFKTASFLAGAALIGAGVLAGTRRRIRRKLQLLEKQRGLERERARIARDIHDDLGASLTRISLLSQSIRGEIGDLPEVGTHVDQIYTTARELTRAMDEIVWAVNPKHDTLDGLMTYLGRFAQQFLSTAGLRCRLDVPMQLPSWPLTSEVRHNVYLALKELLNNAVKHAAATEVRVSLELNSGGFVLLVVDNGRGFDPQASNGDSAVLRGASETGRPSTLVTRPSSGNGLSNIRKRLDEIGASCEWDTAPGEGTRVTIFVPVSPSSPP